MDAIDTPHRAADCAVPPAADFDAFVRAEQAALLRYALLLTGSRAHAEDLVQEVLTRMYSRWEETARRPGSISAYVRRAITNEHLSSRRRWSTRSTVLSADLSAHDRPAAGPVWRPDDALWRSLQALPARQRAAVVLRYYEGLADDEIADVLDCRPGTVRSLVSRGLATLRTRDDVHRAREGDDV
jgi:RNA polymerase sigma-70 factor (sigma-E family)